MKYIVPDLSGKIMACMPNLQNLDSSKFKDFADDISKVDENG